MRVRSARTIVFSQKQGEIVAFNYLTNSAFSCSHDLLGFLAGLHEWTDLDEIADQVPGVPREELQSTLNNLIEVSAVTGENSELAQAEDEFDSSWKWGIPAALFHFSVQDKKYLSPEQTEALQLVKAAEDPQPDLYLRNDPASDRTVALPPALSGNELLQLMARRRTIRRAAPALISLQQLSDCLFAGLGITGHTSNCVGSLPLAMTPSGGARNPYEAYVYARRVAGLEPAFYHYSAFDHSLTRLDGDDLPAPSELLGGQEWVDEMPCLIVLCARFERTMWKYEDANAYRVVLIEAGHIGQNIMLSATRHGLTACPSAALSHSRIKQCLGSENRTMHAPIYALTLGKPGAGLS